MNKNSQIVSVQASAGSGKTYSLAKRYLYILLTKSKDEENPAGLKNIIAVTFANKAAVEMKYRVIDYLKRAALRMDTEGIFDGFGLSGKESALRSRKILEEILDNYDSFNISTIDSFINRILKSCALNLDISPNFRVEKKYSNHLSFALDSFLKNASSSSRLTDLLLNYISQYILSEKTDWFPKNDIYNEIDKVFKKAGNSGKDIETGNESFKKEFIEKCAAIVSSSQIFLEKYQEKGINGHYTSAVKKIAEEGMKRLPALNIPKKFSEKEPKYNKGFTPDEAASQHWFVLSEKIKDLCEFYADNYFRVYADIFSKVNTEFDGVAKKDELVFLNTINRKTLSLFEKGNILMPEVYYRLSEKYKHFLIDEFQDTSPVQWSALKRFLEESLASGGTFFLVGDGKQAIYDFRGGNSEIFYRAPYEFTGIDCDIVLLEQNYRSHKEIVEFNNRIFSKENLKNYLNGVYEEGFPQDYNKMLSIYEKSAQKSLEKKNGGYVEIDIIPDDCDDDEIYTKEKFITYVGSALERFEMKDITVLCKTNAEVLKAGSWLLEKGLKVESTQTLNLRNNTIIKQIMSYIMFIDSPIDTLSFVSFIIGEIFTNKTEIMPSEMENYVFSNNRGGDSEVFYKGFREKYPLIWEEYFEKFFAKAGYIPVYEFVLAVTDIFDIVENFPESKLYLMRFLELIKDFEKEDSGLKNFIEYFNSLEDDDEALYVRSSSGNGIKIMTVHKAKGLQFPVVILPFLKLAENSIDKPYFDTSGEKIKLMSIAKNLANFSDNLLEIYEREKAKSLLSEMNVLYVSLTRAECENYAIIPKKDGASNNTAALLIGGKSITAGKKIKYTLRTASKDTIDDKIISGYKDVQDLLFNKERPKLDTNRIKKRGTILHFALSRIKTLKEKNAKDEIVKACKDAQKKFPYEDISWLEEKISDFLKSADIKSMFDYDEKDVFNEKEIVNFSGETFRIDKLINTEKTVIIVDFKSSGRNNDENIEQVKNYAALIKDIYPEKQIECYIADMEQNEVLEIK